jgi:hypothetical protein
VIAGRSQKSLILLLPVAAVLISSCGHCSSSSSLVPAARSHRQRHDLGSLQTLISGLRLGMPEGDVVALLGEPAYCPAEGTCTYPSDQTDNRGYTISLVVEYRRSTSRDNSDQVVTHRLESYSLFPVGE